MTCSCVGQAGLSWLVPPTECILPPRWMLARRDSCTQTRALALLDPRLTQLAASPEGCCSKVARAYTAGGEPGQAAQWYRFTPWGQMGRQRHLPHLWRSAGRAWLTRAARVVPPVGKGSVALSIHTRRKPAAMPKWGEWQAGCVARALHARGPHMWSLPPSASPAATALKVCTTGNKVVGTDRLFGGARPLCCRGGRRSGTANLGMRAQPAQQARANNNASRMRPWHSQTGGQRGAQRAAGVHSGQLLRLTSRSSKCRP